MSVKTDIELKAQLDSIIKRNDGGEITPELDNALRTNFIDSKLSIKDGGNVLQAVIGYASSQTFNNDNQIPNKLYVDTAIATALTGYATESYVDDAINDIDFSPYALLAGNNIFTEENEFTKAIIATGGLDVFSGALNIGTTNANALFVGRNGLSNLVITSDQLELDAGSSNAEVILYAGGLVTLKATNGFEITGDTKLINLTPYTILELDASKNIISADKGTAYNKDFGTTAGTICEGNDSRLLNISTFKRPIFYDDFTSVALNATWIMLNSAGGGSHALGSSAQQVGEHGLVRLLTGTNATGGRGGVMTPFGIFLGQYAFDCYIKFRIPTLSTASEEFNVLVGLGNPPSNLSSEPDSGLIARYKRSVSGNYWEAITRSSSVSTSKVADGTGGNPAIPVVADDQVIVKISVNAAGTEAVFSIATRAANTTTEFTYTSFPAHITNLPSVVVYPFFYILGEAGSSNRELCVDSFIIYPKSDLAR